MDLSAIAQELKQCGESLLAIAETLSTKEEIPTEKPVTFVEVRTILAEKAGKGFADEVKALIKKHNAEKLSDIPETEYADVIKEAEGIGNAS